MVGRAFVLEHALVIITVYALHIEFTVHELFACSVEVLGSEPNACVAWIDFNPLKVMCEQSLTAEVRSGEIRLPAPAHLVDSERIPMKIAFATLNICRIIISNLN